MAKAKKTPPIARTNTEIRNLLLRYFYDRNDKSTSIRGKKGSAVKISDVKKELKATLGLTPQEILRNLTYLLSEHWVEEDTVEKSFTSPSGTVIPSTTSFYRITAAGIDKIDGPGEFTMPKFHGIKIEATGQNIITVGDGNRVNAKFGDLGNALADLRNAIIDSNAEELHKLALVADIETIQSQLVKPKPNVGILKTAWETVKTAATIDGCVSFVHRATEFITPLLTSLPQ
jgi:hypothetical protein